MPSAFIVRNRNRLLPPPVVRSYDDLKAILNDRRVQLGMSMETLDHRIGWACGYAGKVFGKTRAFSLLSLGEILQALGVAIVVIPEDKQSPLGCQGVDRFLSERMRELGRMGGAARRKQLTAAQWREMCRTAGKQSAMKRARKKQDAAAARKRVGSKRKQAAMSSPLD